MMQLPGLVIKTFIDWQDFCNAFTNRFGNSFEEELEELLGIRQGVDEDVEDFVTRFNAKIAAFHQCGNPLPLLMQKKYFIDSLLPYIRQKVVDRRPRNACRCSQ